MSDPATDPLPEPPRSPRQRWLARLAFSFFVIGAFLFWEAFHVHQRASSFDPDLRQVLYLTGGAMSLALGWMGIRERHRRL